MAEIGAAVASTIIERVVDSIVGHARYLFCFHKSVIDFRKSKRELEKTLQHMKERAKEASTNAEKIVQPVEEWLNDVERVLENAQRLEERVEETQCCLNMTFNYSLAKEVICTAQQMNVLNNNNKFKPFSHPIELSSMNYFFPKDFVAFDSRKPVYEELLKAIQDERKNLIGVVGMEGSGKTALARVVGKQVEESKLFDRVIMTIVSQDVKVRDLQGQIADHFTFSLTEETELGRALRLSHRLKTEKILIILDGVWEKLDLEAIGIPLNENDKRCCILLTTRNQEICTSMNCQSMIELSMLNEDEGWTLFKQRAQIDDDSPEDLREVAKRVFDKCKGLLVAIVTVARTLKGKKTYTSWELAFLRLETSESIDVQEGLTSTYNCNELEEIVCLDSKQAGQLRYLYAPSQPVFPKLRKILIKGCNKLRKIFFPSMISSLPELRELSVHDCNELVKIISSDEVRQYANLSFPKLGVIEIKRCNKLKTIFCATIVLSLPELNELSACDCNNLEDIVSSDADEAQQHSNVRAPFPQFFPNLGRISIENCSKLKTFFSATTVTSLPKLQQLVVKDCNKWEEIIFLDSDQAGQFRNLYPLCNPDCFAKLRSVQIERCNSLKTIFMTTIVTSLPELLELIVKDCDEWMEIISLDLVEARQVGNLSASSKQICFPKLQRIQIESCKKLKTILFATIITSLPELEKIVVKNCNDWEGIVSLDSEEARQHRNLTASSQEVCFPKLKKIEIEKCNKLKAIFSTTILTSSPKLEELTVKDCHELEEIISLDSQEARQLRELYAPSQQICFPMLWRIEIERCNKLKKIFPATAITSLPALEYVVLKDCNEFEEIISSDSKEEIQQRNLSAPFQQVCFPVLRMIDIRSCNKLKALFSATVVTRLPKLVCLVVMDCNEWEEIFSLGSREAGQHNSFLAPFQNICYPELESISVTGCNRLKTIFFLTIVSSFPNLHSLCVADCNNLEAIISPNSMEAEQHRNLSAPPHQVTFPKLKRIEIVRCSKLKNLFFTVILSCLPELNWLYVFDCNELEGIISSETKPLRNLSTFSRQVYFPTLRRIVIERCNKLKTISLTIVRSLPKLGILSVKDCNALEVMFSFDSAEAGEEEQISAPSQQVYLPKLEELLIQRCNKLKTIFSLTIVRRLPELGSLSVYDCNKLEEIFSFDSKKAGEGEGLSAPSQQVCLPKIYSISIRTCNKLKCIFPFSVACHCSSLRFLDIESCPQLEQIVKFEHKAKSEEGAGVAVDDNHDKHLCFPNLGLLRLKKLPTLTETFPWYEPQNCHLIIEDCPKY